MAANDGATSIRTEGNQCGMASTEMMEHAMK